MIATLDLRPHPEGGFYREIFRSQLLVEPADGRGPRSALTSIYFLLPAGRVSRWHRVISDETWHLYEGGPLEVFELDLSTRTLVRHRLATIGSGQGEPTCTIPAGRWQAARPVDGFALTGCTVGPGFDFADFQLLGDDPVAAGAVRSGWPDLISLV